MDRTELKKLIESAKAAGAVVNATTKTTNVGNLFMRQRWSKPHSRITAVFVSVVKQSWPDRIGPNDKRPPYG